jgi:ABC-type molybdate transport system substrate-binding protein
MRRSEATRPARYEAGLGLVTVLVIVVVVAVGAGVLVFSLRGGGKSTSASAKAATEFRTLRTAEAANCRAKGTYASPSTLQANGFLAKQPAAMSVVLENTGSCGSGLTSGFVVGDAGQSAGTSGPVILAAANTTPAFQFMSATFEAANGPIQFTFGASGDLVATAGASGETQSAFFSADEFNTQKLVTTASGGSCTGSDGMAPCTGIGSTFTNYATGHLVVFSCSSGGVTLAPAMNAPHCAAPAGGYLKNPPSSVADVVGDLLANPSWKVGIATPTANSAPYGVASVAALHNACTANSACSWSTLLAKQIVQEGNVTDTQTAVVTGTVQMALLPLSFERSPAGDDTDNWSEVPYATYDNGSGHDDFASGVDAVNPGPIQQWAVVLNNSNPQAIATAKKFLAFVTGAAGQGVMKAFGYTPPGSET